MSSEINTFKVGDYIVFSIMLVASAAIGIAFGWYDRKKKSTKDFLLGGGDLKIFPVGISILASFTSAIAILGFSAEMYRYGTMYWMITISYPFTQGFAALIYIPLFHGLKITSAYQYLELRFNSYVRIAASIIFCLQMFLYMSVALYTPALAIEQVTSIPLIFSIVGTGAICAIYTVIGGMKATVWIDTFQVAIMFTGLFVIIIKGTLEIPGGFTELWKRADRSGRVDFFNFDLNPFKRHTFWTLFIGGFFTNLTIYGSNQGTIQRYLTVKRWQDASKALMINLMGGFLLLTLTCLSGLVAYAKYYDCDLLGSDRIKRGEQILPFLVMDVLGKLPGLPGLFVATIYSAALSTISGGMNSLAAVCITDFVKPTYARYKGHFMHEDFATKITKGLALFFGAASIGLAYLCQYFGNTVLQLSLSIFGLLGGPLLGVISLGMFVKKANWVGALTGLILSTAANIWVGIGGVLYAKPVGLKPLTTEGCKSNLTTISPLISTTSTSIPPPVDLGPTFYQLSYLYYSLYACIITFFFGIIVSIVAEKLKWVQAKEIDPIYLVNWKIWKNNRITQIVTKEPPEEEDIELNEKEEIVYF